MGILNKNEIARRIAKGELILNPRKVNGEFDLQPASYDLSAGRAVWKEASKRGAKVREMAFEPNLAGFLSQPYVVLQPGQMMSIITREEICMPLELCGTVFSKNSLALNGIFAFNAGHVDPGFKGPIVIRVINLRAAPWTFTLGDRIFTIVFQTVDFEPEDRLASRGEVSQEETLKRVRHFTDVALSNALFDLYADKIEARLSEHKTETFVWLNESLGKEFIRKEKIWSELWTWARRASLALLGLLGLIFAIIRGIAHIRSLLQ